MPFRAKMKRALRRSGSSSNGSELTQTDTSKSKKPKKEKLPDNVYKPGEPMPRPKYRGPYNQAHQDKLSAFSFGDMWNRRKSSATGNSDISPMGSRIMSRRGSAWSRRSRLGSRRNSNFAKMDEGDDAEHDVANVGLSRQHTAENRRPRNIDSEMAGLATQNSVTNGHPFGLETQRTITNGANGRLFTEHELAAAMSQSTLKPSRRD